jgi:ribosomal protein L24E
MLLDILYKVYMSPFTGMLIYVNQDENIVRVCHYSGEPSQLCWRASSCYSLHCSWAWCLSPPLLPPAVLWPSVPVSVLIIPLIMHGWGWFLVMYTSLNYYHLWSSLHQRGSHIPKGRGHILVHNLGVYQLFSHSFCCEVLLLALPVFYFTTSQHISN